MLKAEDMTFHRGEDGNLLPQEVTLDTLKDKPIVKIRPLSRGKLQEIYQKATSKDIKEKLEADSQTLIEGLVEPKLTEEQIKDLKPQFANAISIAIMALSLGITQDEVKDKAQEIINDQEDILKKN